MVLGSLGAGVGLRDAGDELFEKEQKHGWVVWMTMIGRLIPTEGHEWMEVVRILKWK